MARNEGTRAEVMVILDSDHYAVHVMGELQAYATSRGAEILEQA